MDIYILFIQLKHDLMDMFVNYISTSLINGYSIIPPTVTETFIITIDIPLPPQFIPITPAASPRGLSLSKPGLSSLPLTTISLSVFGQSIISQTTHLHLTFVPQSLQSVCYHMLSLGNGRISL